MIQQKDELGGQETSCSGAKPCRLHPNGCTNADVLFNLINRTHLGSLHKDTIVKRNSLFGRKTQSQASFDVNSIASYYPNFSRLYIPFLTISKLAPGMQGLKKLVKKSTKNSLQDESNKERSIRRTKRRVKDYVEWNKFEYFVTFTFKKDRQNIAKCRSKMAYWLQKQKKKYPDLKYLIVPEFHKDEKSLHFHALIKGFRGNIKQAVNPKNGRILRGIYSIPSYRSGFSNLKKIKDTKESHAKVGSYLGKYITKDMVSFPNKHRYMCSSELALPIVEYNPPAWHKGLKPLKQYVNDYGITLIFDYISPLVGMR